MNDLSLTRHLSDEAQRDARLLISLSEHRDTSLLDNLLLGERGGLNGEVCVHNAALGGEDVLFGLLPTSLWALFTSEIAVSMICNARSASCLEATLIDSTEAS